jgi:hypothetical protein
MLAALTGCHTSAPRLARPDHAQAPDTPRIPEGSYDWHDLLIAPFGSVLKDIPAALHEVLLFRDQAHGAAAADDAAAGAPECYAADSPALRFAGRTPDEYLLCFRQDRLSRIQATVRLAPAGASGVFAAACADWLKHAALDAETQSAAGPDAAAPGVAAPGVATPDAIACDGRDGAIRFSGRLGEEADLSITLDGVPAP